MPTNRRSPIGLANEQIAITFACQLIGMDIPDDIGYGRSMKVRCPFGDLYHRDGGVDPSFRIYPDGNSAHCFNCSQSYSPVWLVATAWGITARQAAVELLERAGVTPPVDLADAWQRAADRRTTPNITLLAEALKTFCARVATEAGVDWEDAQFTPSVAGVLSRCLGLLDHVTDDTGATQWLVACKTIMRRSIDGTTVYVRQTSA